MRDTLLTLHILAAGAWFGTNVVQIAVNPTLGSKSAEVAADWHRTLVKFSRYLYMPASLIILGTGVWMVLDSDAWEFSQAFVSIGFLAIILGAVLGMAFFAPNSRKAADALDNGDTDTARAIEQRVNIVGSLDTVVIIVTVVAMVAKWGA